MEPVNVFDYEKLAQGRMAGHLWDFFQGGSDDEVTMRECRAAFERIRLRPRVLVDVSVIDMSTEVLGTPVAMPMLIAPTAAQCVAHPEGECATAQAVGRARRFEIGVASGRPPIWHRSSSSARIRTIRNWGWAAPSPGSSRTGTESTWWT